MTAYHPRDLSSRIVDALENMPVVVLSGARQVGKTTILRRDPAFEGRRYLNLDVFEQRETIRHSPTTLLSEPTQVTIDEIQRAPELLVEIKQQVDGERTPGRFLLSGSANLSLMAQVSESLAGRAIYLGLEAFNRREIASRTAERPFLPDFFANPTIPESTIQPIEADEVLLGGMPSVCLGESRKPQIWFQGYEQTYLERDVRNLAQIGDLSSFRRVLHLAAHRSGGILNVSDFARDAANDHATAQRYLSILEASFVLRRIPPWRGNRASRLIKSPKLYLNDSGLAAWLIDARDISPRAADLSRGPLFETYAAANLQSILYSHWPSARLHFWAEHGRYEVDFVIDDGRHVLAIEVKSAERWNDRDVRGLRRFLDLTPSCRAAILAHNGQRAAQLGDRLWAVPLGLLLS